MKIGPLKKHYTIQTNKTFPMSHAPNNSGFNFYFFIVYSLLCIELFLLAYLKVLIGTRPLNGQTDQIRLSKRLD